MAWQRYIGEPLSGYPFDSNGFQPSLVPNTVDRPGPIDNSDIIERGSDSEDDDPQLLRTLQEGRDYVLVPKDVWERLYEW